MEWPGCAAACAGPGAGDVAVSFSLLNRGIGPSDAPPQPWDGAHLGLRYQGECRSYYVSLNRRDGLLVIKKKAPDGLSDCGSYYALSDYVRYPVPYDQWQSFRATIRDGADGSVTIKVWAAGKLVAVGRDEGAGGPPIRDPGEIVLRSDGADLEFRGMRVETLRPQPVAQAAGTVK